MRIKFVDFLFKFTLWQKLSKTTVPLIEWEIGLTGCGTSDIIMTKPELNWWQKIVWKINEPAIRLYQRLEKERRKECFRAAVWDFLGEEL